MSGFPAGPEPSTELDAILFVDNAPRSPRPLTLSAAGVDAPAPLALEVPYQFDPGWRYLTVAPRRLLAIPAGAQAAIVWVRGNESGDLLRCRFHDATGQTFQPDMGRLDWSGWRPLPSNSDLIPPRRTGAARRRHSASSADLGSLASDRLSTPGPIGPPVGARGLAILRAGSMKPFADRPAGSFRRISRSRCWGGGWQTPRLDGAWPARRSAARSGRSAPGLFHRPGEPLWPAIRPRATRGGLPSLRAREPRSHHRSGADLDPVEQDRPHADQTFVLDDTAVQDDAVADGDAMADQAGDARVGVNHGEVLQVRPFADAYPLGIPPDHRVIPDAGIRSDLDVSQNDGAGRNEGGRIDHGRQGLCSPGVPRRRVKDDLGRIVSETLPESTPCRPGPTEASEMRQARSRLGMIRSG